MIQMLSTNHVQTETGNVKTPADSNRLDPDKIQEALIKNRIKGMTRKKKLFWLLGIVLVVIVSFYGWNKYSAGSKDAGFLTMTVARNTITDSIECTGTLSSIKESAMGFKNDDTIIALNVQPGDHVTEGQVLAQQDSTTLQSALQQAIRTVEQDEINLKSSTLTCETNLKTWEQQKALFQAGVIAENELDTAQNDYTRSEWDVATAKSKLLNDQDKVAQAQSNLDGATLIAPFNGIIGAVNGQVGQINGINSSSSTLLTVMSEELQLSALVNEADIGKIAVDQEVEFTSSSFSDLTFKGKVLRITPQAETVSNVQYYPVLISCIDPDHKLLSGMSVSANIIIARQSDVLTVPMMAVSYAQTYIRSNAAAADRNNAPQPETRNDLNNQGSSDNSSRNTASGNSSRNTTQTGKHGMIVVQENDKPVVKPVVLGLSDGTNYEVIEGLAEGDKVIVGSSSIDTSSSASPSSSNSGNNSSNRIRVQGGGGMGRPPGF